MITKNDQQLGRHIRRLRRQRQLTQRQLAETVQVTEKYIQYLEAAKRIPRLKLLYRIARALRVRVQDLFPF